MNAQHQTEFADVKAVALDFIIAAVGEQLPGMVRQAEEFAETLAPVIRVREAQAWGKGFIAARGHLRDYRPNPYREEE